MTPLNSAPELTAPVPTPEAIDRLRWRDLVQLAETVLFVVGLTHFTGGLGVGVEMRPTETVRVSVLPPVLLSLIAYGVWAGSIGFILISWRTAVQRVLQAPWLWALIAMLLLSGLWSFRPDFVNLMNREVWQMSCFALFVVTRFTFLQQIRLITLTFGVGALLSTVLAFGLPSLGRHTIDHVGAWKGLYDYKNTLGGMMLIGLLGFMCMTANRGAIRLYQRIGFWACFAIILLTTSKTALILVVVMIAMVQFFRHYRWQGNWSIVLTSLTLPVLVGSVLGILGNWAPLVKGLGKDPTMSGRTQIWAGAWHHLMESPWFGFGRSAFWSPGSLYALRAGERVHSKYVPPHGHNGFIDLMLDVGLVGFGLFLLVFLVAYTQSLWLAYNAQQMEEYWPVCYLTYLFLNNMTESFLARLANPYWVLFMIVCMSVPTFIAQRARDRYGGDDARSPLQSIH
jgi:O-antigen ligase